MLLYYSHQENLIEKRYHKYVGQPLKEERLKQDLNQSQLARLSRIASSYISKIENNRYVGDDEIIKLIFHKLNIEFTLDKESLSILNNKLDDFYIQLVLNHNELFLNSIQEIINNERKYIYSLTAYKYYLIRYIWAVTTFNEDEITLYKNILDKKILKRIDLTSYEKQIYLDYQGIYYQMKSQLSKSIEILNQAKQLGKFNYSYGMVCYHLGMAYDKNNDLIEALMNEYEAEEIFDRELNIKRHLFVKVHIANILSRNHNYDKAENIYLSILKQVDNSNLDFMKYITLENHIWNLIKQRKYQEAEILLPRINDNELISKFTHNNYFQSAFIYYHLNNYELSKQWINLGKEISKDSILNFKLYVIEQLINHNKLVLLSDIKDFLKKNKNHLESETTSFLVNILINICEENHYYKDAFYYQRKFGKDL